MSIDLWQVNKLFQVILMLTFTQTITKLLNHYKAINRRDLSAEEWSAKMDVLKLRRKHLREDNEVALYHKGHRVLEDIAQRIKNTNLSCWYSGLDEFYQHFKSVLSEYHIEEGKVVHGGQQASRAIVLALQLMNSRDISYDSSVVNQLDQCGRAIAKYGTLEQKTMFSKALKNFQQYDINCFQTVYEKFEKYLEKFSDFFSGKEVRMSGEAR